MGLMDAITAEDRVQLKVSDLETLMKNAAKADLIFNGIRAEVPHRYMREIVTGKKEEEDASGHPSVIAAGVGKKGDKTCQTCDH